MTYRQLLQAIEKAKKLQEAESDAREIYRDMEHFNNRTRRTLHPRYTEEELGAAEREAETALAALNEEISWEGLY